MTRAERRHLDRRAKARVRREREVAWGRELSDREVGILADAPTKFADEVERDFTRQQGPPISDRRRAPVEVSP